VSILRKYEPNPIHVLNFKEIKVDDKGSYIEKPVQIMDKHEQVIKNKVIPLVKVLWKYHGTEKAT